MISLVKNRSLLISLALIICSCSGDGGEPSVEDNSKDRQAILTYWADNIIVPSYANFKVKFDVMLGKADAFTTSPNNSSLVEFREAWVEAYGEWQKVELFEFGPADKYTLRNFYNIYPTDVNGLTSNINDPSVNLDLPTSYARQGFPALDFLLNGVGEDDNAIVAYYTTDTDAAKRVAYLKRITARMNTLLTNVITEWSSYRETFISKTSLDIGSSFPLVVNAYVLHYERYIRSGKFGIPAGATTSGGTTFPETVEAFYKKDISLMLAKNAHNAAVDFFNGKSVKGATTKELSFKSYLDDLGAKDASTGTALSTLFNAQFTVISNLVEALPSNFNLQVQNNRQSMVDVYNEMQKLIYMLKVDFISAVSVTITYTDNDGD